jgi:hypothetical protein
MKQFFINAWEAIKLAQDLHARAIINGDRRR